MSGDFGSQLQECRRNAKPKILQREIGKAVSKSSSVISKWESEKEDVRRDVAFCDSVSLERIVALLRTRDVPEDMISGLQDSWREEIASRRGSQGYDDPLVENLRETLSDVPFDDRRALTAEIALTLFKWRELKRIKDDFDKGKLTFASGEGEVNELMSDVKPNGYRWLSRAKLFRGKLRGYQGKSTRASDDFKEGFDHLANIGSVDPQLRVELAIEHADLLRTLDSEHWADARRSYKRVLEIDNRDEMVALVERKLAGIDIFAGTPLKGLDHAKRSRRLSVKIGDPHLERKAREHVAWADAYLGNLSKAISEQEKAHGLAEKYPDVHLKEHAKSHRYLGDYYALAGLPEKARDAYSQAFKYVNRTREGMKNADVEQEMVISVWIHLGMSEMLLQGEGDIPAIQEHLLASYRISKEMGYVVAQGLYFKGSGDHLMREGQMGEALEKYDEAMRIFSTTAGETKTEWGVGCNPYYLTLTLLRMVNYHFMATGDFGECLRIARSAMELAEEHGLGIQLARALIWITKLKLADTERNEGEALDLLARGISYAVGKDDYLLASTMQRISGTVLEDTALKPEVRLRIANELRDSVTTGELVPEFESENQKEILANWVRKLKSQITGLKSLT